MIAALTSLFAMPGPALRALAAWPLSFQAPWAFGLLLLPLLVRLAVPAARIAPSGALRVPFFHEIRRAGLLGQAGWRSGPSLRLALLGLIYALLVTAAARPVMMGPPIALPQEGRDLMLAVDLSGSMALKDLTRAGQPADRLTVVKAVADDFISRRIGDRIGLILFSSRAYIQSPLTFDRTVVRQFLDQATIGLTGQETAIGDAIALAIKVLRERPDNQRVLILLTDGANNSGMLDPQLAADAARQEHVKIYTIGVGADRMMMGARMVNPAEDLDEDALKTIAATTGGRYFRARDPQDLASIYADIDRMEPSAGDPLYLRPTLSLLHWPLGLALVLSFAASGLWLAPGWRTKRASRGRG